MNTNGNAGNKLDLPEIREYWTQQATAHGDDPAASWTDRAMIDLEIRTISTYLRPGEQVLDIGCANGYSTMHFAAAQSIRITGLDYIPEMIAAARERAATLPAGVRDRVQFAVGDITRLDVKSGSYDLAVVIRVVINLGSWENQRRGLQEAARALKPGGRLLLSEATVQGLGQLNRFRDEWGLPPIPEPSFNCYLDEKKVVEELAGEMELEEIRDFASTYYIATRVFKPWLAKVAANEERIADPLMHFNRWCSMLPAAGDYGTQKLFVLRKRDSRQ